ncbi:ATP binding cassette sub family F [Trichuris trichiura]|uniref:ATP binding cassette sub family F n=1 Tax=Trichuris trichiura TaxID=36087 RepID=A0A077Z9Q1_TRITR|nr:ATP binding cassette sub family F [Trichuris trichiura]
MIPSEMPSDARKRRDAKKKELAKQRDRPAGTAKEGNRAGVANVASENNSSSQAFFLKQTLIYVAYVTEADPTKNLIDAFEAVEIQNANARSTTGVLTSHPKSRDIKIEGLTLTFYGSELLSDARLELNWGRRYGLIGLNGCGKSTLLHTIANHELPIPEHFDIYLLSREMPAIEKSAINAVMDVDQERLRLEREAEELAHADDAESSDKLMDIYDRLEDISADTAEARAAEILFGLGFTNEMMHRPCKDFSGGWRMRISLARALFLRPCLLLLDEPTNHLDLHACVWLEEELKKYKRILVIVSHSQDFLNGVCTNIIHLRKQKLAYYSGNYDQFVKTRLEQLENQMKRYNWEQAQVAHMKDYIARFGHGSAKLARQAQSKEKVLGKMVASGLTEKVVQDKVKQFYFFDPGYIPPPVIMVQHISFRYGPNSPWIYKDYECGIDLTTRIALVGPNGAGKTTFLKLISGELLPTDGLIRRHSHVKIGRYHQHLHELLDLNISALEYMLKSYPEVKEKEDMRKIIGRYGITGRQQICPMKQLSDGQRCRVSFAWLAWQRPHILLLDEPTNHLDMESIDALAEAINDFEGGMLLVSHDFRLVSQVAKEIWLCDKNTISKWPGDIFSYKKNLREQIEKCRQQA